MKVDFASERQIEDFVFNQMTEDSYNPILEDVHEGLAWRQVSVPGYGIADIVTVEMLVDSWVVTVYELKNEVLNEKHVGQVARYMRGIERTLRSYPRRVFGDRHMVMRGVIAGPFEPKGDLVYLLPKLSAIRAFSLSLDMLNGFAAQRIEGGWFNSGETRRIDRSLWAEVTDFFGGAAVNAAHQDS